MLCRRWFFALFACLSICTIPPNRAQAVDRPLADWVKDLDSDQLIIREEAIEMIASLGADARSTVPRLKVLLKDERPIIRIRAAFALIKIDGKPEDYLPVLVDSGMKGRALERVAALNMAISFGITNPHVDSLLSHCLTDKETRVWSHAYRMIGRFGPEAAPVVLRLVDHEDTAVVVRMLRLIESMRLDSATLETQLKPRLKDKTVIVRALAASCLLRAMTDPDSVLPTITEIQAGRDREAYQIVMLAVVETGPPSPKLTPFLEEALKDSRDFRIPAAYLLLEGGNKSKEAVAIVVQRATTAIRSERAFAVAFFYRLGVAAKEIVPAYMQKIRDETAPTLPQPGYDLSQLGANAVEPLMKFAEDPNERVRSVANAALQRIGDAGMAPLLKVFAKATGKERLQAIGKFAAMRSNASAAVPGLVEILKTGTAEEMYAAFAALTAIGPSARAALPRALEMLNDPKCSPANRLRLFDLFAEIGPWAGKAAPALAKIATNEKNTLAERHRALTLLSQIGASAHESLPPLIETARQDKTPLGHHAAIAAFQIAPHDQEVEKLLLELLKDRSPAAQLLARNIAEQSALLPAKLSDELLTAIIHQTKPATGDIAAFVTILGRLEQPPPLVAEYLEGLLDQEDIKVKTQAALSLVKLGVFDVRVERLVEESLIRDGDAPIYQLLDDLKRRGAKARPMAGLLLRAAQRQQYAARRLELLEALATIDAAQIKPFADWLKEQLHGSLHGSLTPDAVSSMHVLWRFDPAYDPLPALRRMLKITSYWQYLAAETLGKMGPAAKIALPDLVEATKSSDPSLRAKAAVAVLAIDRSHEDKTLPILAELLNNRDRDQAPADARTYIARIAKSMGADGKRFVPILLEALRRADASDRYFYQSAIQRIDPQALNIKSD